MNKGGSFAGEQGDHDDRRRLRAIGQGLARAIEPRSHPPAAGERTGANGASAIGHAGLVDARLHLVQRQAVAARIGRDQGNQHVQRAVVQAKRGRPVPRGSVAAGMVRNAVEVFYVVRGDTLHALVPQLARFDGFAAETTMDLTISERVRPQRGPDDQFTATVRWTVRNTVVNLPRWADYGGACPAARAEWDRFLAKTREHEQRAHVDMALQFVRRLGPDDAQITGVSVADVQSNLEAKQTDLNDRLQALHDACDHGVASDAVLYPNRGRCSKP